jgi:transposase
MRENCTSGLMSGEGKRSALQHATALLLPLLRRQKNDGNDAEAICTAARQPHIPFVPKKTVEQQDIQALHRARQRMVNHRTAVVSQIRGLLLDRRFAIAKSITRARRAIPEFLAGQDNELTAMVRDAIAELYDLFRDLDRRIGCSTGRLTASSTRTRHVSASRRSRALARRPPQLSWPQSATGWSSRTAVTSPPGLVSSRHSSPAAIARC